MTKEESTVKFEEWCAEFGEAEVEPMSENLSKAFMVVTMAEMHNGDVPSLEKSFIYQILDKRAEFIGLKLNKYAKVLLALLADRPGTIVMYLYYLKRYQMTIDSAITIGQIANIFPFGFPTEQALNKLWDSQKVQGGNLLDTIQM